MNTKDPLILERIRKVQDIKDLGINPYAKNRFTTTHHSVDAIAFGEENGVRDVKDITSTPLSDQTLKIAGRLVLFRSMGKLAFGHIRDMKGQIQVCFQRDMFDVFDGDGETKLDVEKKSAIKFIEKLVDLGDFIGVEGELFKTNHGEITLYVKKCTFLSKALRPMPEKFHGVTDRETMYRERNLDLMTNQETMNRFVLRSKMVQEIREFFHEKDFLEIETPILQPQAGGAMAKTFETHHNALDHDFVLRIAPELDLKRVIGGGMERIFEIGKDFRNEGTDPSHLQEFTMLEWYGAYMDINDNKELIEEMIHLLCKKVFKKDVFTVRDTEGNETQINFGEKFANKRFPDLIKEYTGLDMVTASLQEIQEVAKGLGITTEGIGRGNLLDDIYKKTARPELIQPTFVYDYPEELKPLAAPNGDGTASCYQLVVNSWEIVNSYGELIDPQVQRKLLEDQSDAKAGGDDEAMEVDEVFLKAMEHGFPSMTGCGFGIDRLAAIFTGMPNLRDVVLFPTVKPQSIKNKKLEMNSENNTETNNCVPTERTTNEEILKTDETEKKVFVVLNKKIEEGRLMNAIGHLTFGISAFQPENKNLLQYQDKDEVSLGNISHHAVIVLQAKNSNQLLTLKTAADENEIENSCFTESMTVGSSADQVEATKNKSAEDHDFFGVCLFGEVEQIQPLTKKFSLWK